MSCFETNYLTNFLKKARCPGWNLPLRLPSTVLRERDCLSREIGDWFRLPQSAARQSTAIESQHWRQHSTVPWERHFRLRSFYLPAWRGSLTCHQSWRRPIDSVHRNFARFAGSQQRQRPASSTTIAVGQKSEVWIVSNRSFFYFGRNAP